MAVESHGQSLNSLDPNGGSPLLLWPVILPSTEIVSTDHNAIHGVRLSTSTARCSRKGIIEASYFVHHCSTLLRSQGVALRVSTKPDNGPTNAREALRRAGPLQRRR